MQKKKQGMGQKTITKNDERGSMKTGKGVRKLDTIKGNKNKRENAAKEVKVKKKV